MYLHQNHQPQSPKFSQFLNKAYNIDLKKQGAARAARFQDVHVEHIYPQKPSTGWAGFDSKGVPENHWINNIGNQTLLDKELNQSASNKIFSDKIRYYKKKPAIELGKGIVDDGTVFDMTWEIHDAYDKGETDWTADRIKERAGKIATEAKTIWAI